MMEVMREGGYMMYPLMAIALAVLGLTAWSWAGVRNGPGRDAVLETRIDSVLFWGVYGVILGVLGTLIGISQAASAIQAFGGESVSAALVWGGIRVALTTVIAGFLIFSVAFVFWFALRVRYRRAVAV
jgi:hypothetical protein